MAELNEHQCFALMLDQIAGVRDCMRGMASLRKDMRWLVLAQKMDEMRDMAKRQMNRPGSQLLWMPHRTGAPRG